MESASPSQLSLTSMLSSLRVITNVLSIIDGGDIFIAPIVFKLLEFSKAEWEENSLDI